MPRFAPRPAIETARAIAAQVGVPCTRALEITVAARSVSAPVRLVAYRCAVDVLRQRQVRLARAVRSQAIATALGAIAAEHARARAALEAILLDPDADVPGMSTPQLQALVALYLERESTPDACARLGIGRACLQQRTHRAVAALLAWRDLPEVLRAPLSLPVDWWRAPQGTVDERTRAVHAADVAHRAYRAQQDRDEPRGRPGSHPRTSKVAP